jgi:hypothetical protein
VARCFLVADLVTAWHVPQRLRTRDDADGVVTNEAAGDVGGPVAGHKFWVRHEDAPASSAQPFGTAEEAEEYLAEPPDKEHPQKPAN